MKVCLAQLEVTAKKEDNLRKVSKVLEGLEEGTQLTVFPEYTMGFPEEGLNRRYVSSISEKVDGDFVRTVASLSRKERTAVLLPIFERAPRKVYNTSVILDKGRVLGCYRKMKLFDALGYRESGVFGTGSQLVIFRLGGMCFGTVTCYDIRFPELIKAQALAGAEAILIPSAWYRGPLKEEQWQMLLMARAHEDTSYVVGVGNANEAFIGRSMVLTPQGIKAIDLGTGERVAYFDLDRRTVADARRRLPVLKQSPKSALSCLMLN